MTIVHMCGCVVCVCMLCTYVVGVLCTYVVGVLCTYVVSVLCYVVWVCNVCVCVPNQHVSTDYRMHKGATV